MFGCLKGRWRCQAKRNYISTASLPDVVVACCVLHNVCELNKEHLLPEWNTEQPILLPKHDQVAYLCLRPFTPCDQSTNTYLLPSVDA